MADGETNGIDAQADAQKGAKARSGTSYPFFGLPTALKIVDAIRAAGGDEAANADVLSALGATKNDRLWAYGVPAAIQFGLVERVGRGDVGRVRITDLAKRIALPTTVDEKRAAKGEAFQQPELYQKLLERFAGHPLPQKDGLRNLLCREYQIVESMAAGAAEAFIESLREADLVSPQDTVLQHGSGAPVGDAKGGKPKNDPPPDPDTQVVRVPADYIVYKCKLGQGRVIEIPLPPRFSKADAGRLHAFLLTQVDEEPDTTGGG